MPPKKHPKNPPPSADDIWSTAETLLEIAYRIQTGKFNDWRSRDSAHLLLDGIDFKNFRQSQVRADDGRTYALFTREFIAIHKKSHGENWPENVLRTKLAFLLVCQVDEVPEELVRLKSNPTKSTPQGVVEDANYTCAMYFGQPGMGDTNLKRERSKLKMSASARGRIEEFHEWINSGEYEKFQIEVRRRLFGASAPTPPDTYNFATRDGVVKVEKIMVDATEDEPTIIERPVEAAYRALGYLPPKS